MQSIFDTMMQHKHEKVCLATDSVSGLRAVIALHNTVRGPAIGGVRLWQYDNDEAAIQDVLRLSEAMTLKAAVADIPFGGGKSVILADGKEQEPGIRAARLRAFGRFVESLGGWYIAAPDVGTSPADMTQIKIERLSCQIIAGAANNQLEDDRHAEHLRQCSIVYGVDNVLNAGGLITAAQELEGYDHQKARQRVAHMYYTVKRMLAIAQAQQISTLAAARQMATEVLQRPDPIDALARP